jgi:hypothetical protein
VPKYRRCADISSFIWVLQYPVFFIFYCKVVRFIPSNFAAHVSPPTCQLVIWRAFRMCWRTFPSRVQIPDWPSNLFSGNHSHIVKRLPGETNTARSIIFSGLQKFWCIRNFSVLFLQLWSFIK